VFRLFAVFPVKKDDELSRCFVLARVNALDMILPQTSRRVPGSSLLRSPWRLRVRRMTIPFRSLAGGGDRSGSGRGTATPFLALGGFLGFVEDPLPTTKSTEILVKYLGGAFPIVRETLAPSAKSRCAGKRGTAPLTKVCLQAPTSDLTVSRSLPT
jgi:hypothetical protein